MSTGFSAPPSFGPPSFNQPPRTSSGMKWVISLLLIGLGILILGGAVCVGGVWYIASNIDKWVVGLGREAIVAAINESELPQEEKAEVITQVDRVVTAYKEHKINQEDLQRVMTELQDSPTFTALTLYGVEDEYLTGTHLTEKEIESGRRTFQRVLRGVYEGKISEDDFFDALPEEEVVPVEDEHGKKHNDRVRLASNQHRQDSADDDLRLSLTKLKVLADNARIPDEPFKIKVSDEVKKLVDKALAGK